jgi:cytochrome b
VTAAAAAPAKVRVWDLPVRLTHWSIVVLVATSWVTIEQGWMLAHRISGYAILALVAFRLFWGFAGSATARFGQFLRGPGAALREVRGFFVRTAHASVPGHNALGGWNVVAMLLLMLAQAGLGLFATDEFGGEGGPLSRWISFEAARRVADLHATVFNLLVTCIVLHVAAVAAHLVLKRENLVGPMVTGRKWISGPPPALAFVGGRRALLGAVVAAIAVAALVNLA